MLAVIQLPNTILGTVDENSSYTLPDGRYLTPTAPWSDGTYQLRTIAPAAPVAPGYQATGQRVEMVGGIPKFVYDIAPIPTQAEERQKNIDTVKNTPNSTFQALMQIVFEMKVADNPSYTWAQFEADLKSRMK